MLKNISGQLRSIQNSRKVYSKKKTRIKGVGGGELKRNQDHSENGREFFKGKLPLEIQEDVVSKT